MRSPASTVCRRAASIVVRTRAAKILFPEATRGPWPSSAAPLNRWRTAAPCPERATARLGTPLRQESCLDSTSMPEAARVKLQRVSVDTRCPVRCCGGFAARRHVPCHAALKTDAAAPTLRAALRLWCADAPMLSFCKVTQPKSYSQRRRAALWCVAAAPPAQCVSATALDDRLLVSAAVRDRTQRRAWTVYAQWRAARAERIATPPQ